MAAAALIFGLIFAWAICVNAYRDHHGYYPRGVQPRAKAPTQRELYEILAGPVATRELELRCQAWDQLVEHEIAEQDRLALARRITAA